MLIRILIIVASSVIGFQSYSQETLEKAKINFEIDTSRWIYQEPSEVIKYFEELGGVKPRLSENDLIAVYSTSKYPVVNFPLIMIADKDIGHKPPSFDQIERELNAMTAELDEIDPSGSMQETISDWDFKKPLLIREKQLILMEFNSIREDGSKIDYRQGIFFKETRIINIQLVFYKGRDDEYLADFNRIIDTFKF